MPRSCVREVVLQRTPDEEAAASILASLNPPVVLTRILQLRNISIIFPMLKIGKREYSYISARESVYIYTYIYTLPQPKLTALSTKRNSTYGMIYASHHYLLVFVEFYSAFTKVKGVTACNRNYNCGSLSVWSK